MIVCTLLYGCGPDKHEECLQAPTAQCLMTAAFETSGATDWTRQELEEDQDKQQVIVALASSQALLGNLDNAIELLKNVPVPSCYHSYSIINELAYHNDVIRAQELVSKYLDTDTYCHSRGLAIMAAARSDLGDQITAETLFEEAIEAAMAPQTPLTHQAHQIYLIVHEFGHYDELRAHRLLQQAIALAYGYPGEQAKYIPSLAKYSLSEARTVLEMAKSSLYMGRAGGTIADLSKIAVAEAAVGNFSLAQETTRYLKEVIDINFQYDKGWKNFFFWNYYLPTLAEIGEIETALNLAETTGDEERIESLKSSMISILLDQGDFDSVMRIDDSNETLLRILYKSLALSERVDVIKRRFEKVNFNQLDDELLIKIDISSKLCSLGYTHEAKNIARDTIADINKNDDIILFALQYLSFLPNLEQLQSHLRNKKAIAYASLAVIFQNSTKLETDTFCNRKQYDDVVS